MSDAPRGADIGVWPATTAEVACHYSVRHRVFVLEQGIMELTDIDAHDADPDVVHVLAARGHEVAGAVRLYPVAGDLWQGDRLAVLPGHRTSLVGVELVRYAVASAAAAGGAVMHAQVQLPNVRFFLRLGWTLVGEPAPYCGFDHQKMAFDLATAGSVDRPGRPDGLLMGRSRVAEAV